MPSCFFLASYFPTPVYFIIYNLFSLGVSFLSITAAFYLKECDSQLNLVIYLLTLGVFLFLDRCTSLFFWWVALPGELQRSDYPIRYSKFFETLEFLIHVSFPIVGFYFCLSHISDCSGTSRLWNVTILVSLFMAFTVPIDFYIRYTKRKEREQLELYERMLREENNLINI